MHTCTYLPFVVVCARLVLHCCSLVQGILVLAPTRPDLCIPPYFVHFALCCWFWCACFTGLGHNSRCTAKLRALTKTASFTSRLTINEYESRLATSLCLPCACAWVCLCPLPLSDFLALKSVCASAATGVFPAPMTYDI